MRKVYTVVLSIIVLAVTCTFLLLTQGCGANTASAVLGTEPQLTSMSVWVTDNDANRLTSAVAQKDGKSCWTLGADIGRRNIVADVNDVYVRAGDRNAAVTVTYYDTGYGAFALWYTADTGEVKQTESVYMQNEGAWKQYTFFLADAVFNNAIHSGDFLIGVNTYTAQSFSGDNVYIQRISVERLKTLPADMTAAARLGATTSCQNISAVVYGETGQSVPVKDTVASRECWTLRADEDARYLLLNVAESYIDAEVGGVEVTVEYFDKGTGMLALQYNSGDIACSLVSNRPGNIFKMGDEIEVTLDIGENSAKLSETVALQDSGTWKTHAFSISDAMFSNALDGGDFRLGAFEYSSGAYLPIDISIRRVAVKKTAQQPARIKTLPIDYALVDLSDNTVLMSGGYDIVLNDGESTQQGLFTAEYNGMFALDVTLHNTVSGQDINKSIPLSVMARNTQAVSVNDVFGVCTHFGKGWRPVDYTQMAALMRDAGIGWIRDEMEWSRAETTKGVVSILPEWDEYVDAALAAGIQPLIILDFGNGFYDEGGFPYTEEGINAFLNYVRTVAGHFDGRVAHFELWNEYNMEGTMFNPTNRTPEDYVKLLKRVYQEIKTIDPGATVIGGAMAGTDTDWLEDILEYGAADYMDAVSFHPYTYPNSPEDGGLAASIQTVSDMAARTGSNLPVWITEIGWPTSEGDSGVSEFAAGAFLVRAYVEAIAAGAEKIFWYNLQDKGADEYNTEHNFGLVRYWYDDETPMAAKANYLAYNTLTGRLGAAKYISDLSDGTIRAYLFRDNSRSRDVLVMWSTGNDTSVLLDHLTGDVVSYNLFSNCGTYVPDGGAVTVSVSGYPVFLEMDDASALMIHIQK